MTLRTFALVVAAAVLVAVLNVQAGLFDAGSKLALGEPVGAAPWWPIAVAANVAWLGLVAVVVRSGWAKRKG